MLLITTNLFHEIKFFDWFGWVAREQKNFHNELNFHSLDGSNLNKAKDLYIYKKKFKGERVESQKGALLRSPR